MRLWFLWSGTCISSNVPCLHFRRWLPTTWSAPGSTCGSKRLKLPPHLCRGCLLIGKFQSVTPARLPPPPSVFSRPPAVLPFSTLTLSLPSFYIYFASICYSCRSLCFFYTKCGVLFEEKKKTIKRNSEFQMQIPSVLFFFGRNPVCWL